jgi:sugar phosphate isomerase/epimerase
VARVGLQLYTIRDECARDLEGSLRRVGELGYDGVELHNLYERDAADVRTMLDESGLAVAGLHAGLDAIEN